MFEISESDEWENLRKILCGCFCKTSLCTPKSFAKHVFQNPNLPKVTDGIEKNQDLRWTCLWPHICFYLVFLLSFFGADYFCWKKRVMFCTFGATIHQHHTLWIYTIWWNDCIYTMILIALIVPYCIFFPDDDATAISQPPGNSAISSGFIWPKLSWKNTSSHMFLNRVFPFT